MAVFCHIFFQRKLFIFLSRFSFRVGSIRWRTSVRILIKRTELLKGLPFFFNISTLIFAPNLTGFPRTFPGPIKFMFF